MNGMYAKCERVDLLSANQTKKNKQENHYYKNIYKLFIMVIKSVRYCVS